MLKFLYIGDMHETETIPNYRIDDFKDTVHNKRQEILQIAKKENVNAILQGGDFLNKCKISDEFLTFLIQEWGFDNIQIQDLLFDIQLGVKSIKDLEMSIKTSIPIIGIAGNHDLVGGALSSYDKTSLSVLEKSGLMKILKRDDELIFQDKDCSVSITGSSYNKDIDEDDKEAYIIDNKHSDYHIHLVHGMLMNKTYGKKFKHTTIDQIAIKTIADLTINGHDHIGYPKTIVNGKTFINPGSIVRMSADKKEIVRMPKVLLITIDKLIGINVEEIYLKCAKKGNEVLSREEIENKLEKIKKITDIDELISKASIKKSISMNKIVENIGNAKGIDKTITKDICYKIETKQNQMSQKANSIETDDYYIEKLELINFLSHKHSSFNLSKGVNVFTGESRAGKSAILRALKELYQCYLPNPSKAIYFQEEFFKIRATLSNGYIITRYVEKKKKGRNLNGYYVHNPDTGLEDFYNTKSVPYIQELLHFKKLPLTEKKDIDINFLMQGQGWFFLQDMTSGERAKLVGVPLGAHIADAVLKDVNTSEKNCNKELKVIKQNIEKKETEIKEYNYLDNLEKRIAQLEILFKNKEILEVKIEQLKKILDKQKKLIESINLINIHLNKIKKNHNILCSKSEIIKLKIDRFEKSKILVSELKEIITKGNVINNYSYQLKPILDVNINELRVKNEEFLKKKNETKKFYKKEKELKVQIDNLENYLKRLHFLQGLNKNNLFKQLDLLKEKNGQVVKGKEHVKELKALLKIGNEENSLLKEVLRKKDILIKEYEKELLNLKECPTCHHEISKEEIDLLVSKFKNNL